MIPGQFLTRERPPALGNTHVYFNEKKYSPDPTHYLPDKSSDPKATAMEVKNSSISRNTSGPNMWRILDIGMDQNLPTSIRARVMPWMVPCI
jgi:hypothetical protein